MGAVLTISVLYFDAKSVIVPENDWGIKLTRMRA